MAAGRQQAPILSATPKGVLLRIRVQPGARTECLDGVRDHVLRLRLKAPPVDGAANAACLAFLTKALRLRRSQIRLQSGHKSRDKLIHIEGAALPLVAAALGIPLSAT